MSTPSFCTTLWFLMLLCVPPAESQLRGQSSKGLGEFDGNEIINRTDVDFLASDSLGGRTPRSIGSIAAQEYLISELEKIGTVGLNSGQNGTGAFQQNFTSSSFTGTNIVAILQGSELPDEYIVLSAHYDGQRFCTIGANADSNICNSASDNAASVAIVLGIGRKVASLSDRPRRSIVFTFWDQEEQGLLGSEYFAGENPLIPLDQITTFLNFDISGTNLLPSLRDTTFAIGAESGGKRLECMLNDAVGNEGLEVETLSAILGMERSDYVGFYTRDVPIVFFTDSTGPCYHTTGDEIKNVDFQKLEKQARIGVNLAVDLANTRLPPKFKAPCLIPAEYSDLWALNKLVNRAVENDLDLFPEEKRDEILFIQSEVNCLTLWGPIAFPFVLAFDRPRLEEALTGLVDILMTTDCSGFLEAS